MTIDLSKISFEKDFFAVSLPDNSILILNCIDESIGMVKGDVDIKRINVQLSFPQEKRYKKLSGIIGINEGSYSIRTLYKEYEGKVLDEDNLKYCTIEISEG